MLNSRYKKSDTQAMLKEHVENWIQNGPDLESIEQANQFGKNISRSVTRSQIRQVFSKLKSIEAKGIDTHGQRSAFLMLKPYIAYAAKRHKDTGLSKLKERIDWGIDAVLSGNQKNEKQRFKNFCMFFEAILAYHRAHGGS